MSDPAAAAPSRPVVIGELVGLHGVRGAFKLRSHCDPPERIFRYKQLYLRLGKQSRPVQLRARKAGSTALIAEFEGFDDRDQATPWVGAELVVDRSQLPKPPPGEYYWTDLEGLRVLGIDGFEFGTIRRMFDTGANHVMVVEGERERMIPFVTGSYVQAVDLDAGLVTVDWDPEF